MKRAALQFGLVQDTLTYSDHHVWVTRYQPRELYAGGDYPNQSEGGDFHCLLKDGPCIIPT